MLSIHHCWSVTAHKAQHSCTDQSPGQLTSSGTRSRHTIFPPQHPQVALQIHVHTHTQASPNAPHGRNNFHSPIPCMVQKWLPGTVAPDSPALPISSTGDCPRTLPVLGPEIQYSITNLFSSKALGTHLDLTFLKTSRTYAEGCNRGDTSSAYQETFQRNHMP